MNNKDKDSLSKLKQDVMKRETWNYKISYDGLEPYRPPTHIPFKPTAEKNMKRYGTVNASRHNNAKFINVESIEESPNER